MAKMDLSNPLSSVPLANMTYQFSLKIDAPFITSSFFQQEYLKVTSAGFLKSTGNQVIHCCHLFALAVLHRSKTRLQSLTCLPDTFNGP